MLLCLWLPVVIERLWTTMRTHGREHASLPTKVLVIAVLGGGIYNLLTMDRPSFVWTHLHEPVWEREKDKAECEMLAIEKIGPGDWITMASGREHLMNAA